MIKVVGFPFNNLVISLLKFIAKIATIPRIKISVHGFVSKNKGDRSNVAQLNR